MTLIYNQMAMVVKRRPPETPVGLQLVSLKLIQAGMTKRDVLRAGAWAAAAVALLVIAVAALALSMRHKFSPDPPETHFPSPSSALEAQRQDVEQFSRLLAMDQSFAPAARAAANRRIAALGAAPAPLDREKFRVALMRIVALADNGHTSLDGSTGDLPNCVGIRVTWFDDGLYVLRAEAGYADLLGARVDSVNGGPTGQVLAALMQLHGGASGWRRLHAALYVQSPGILYGAGLGPSPQESTWTFRLPDGAATTRTLPGDTCGDGAPQALMTRWLSPQKLPGEGDSWRALFSSEAQLPATLRDFNAPFRRSWVDRGCTMFIQLKAIEDAGALRIGDFLGETAAEMTAHPPCNIILDLRFNSGGDYTKIARFASRLPTFVPHGRVYILTGPQTFSAAITTAAFVKQAAGPRAVILGEPVGDRLAFYSEGNRGCLAHAPLCVHYATGMHDYAHRCDDWRKCFWLNWLFPVRVGSLDPDGTIATTFSDYGAHRDPVLERAITLAARG